MRPRPEVARTKEQRETSHKKEAPSDAKQDVVGKPILKKETATPDVSALRREIEEIAERNQSDTKQKTKESTTQAPPASSGGFFKSLSSRVRGWFGSKKEAPAKPEVPAPTEQELAQAREAMVELPENPSTDEVREALAQLIGNLPELQENSVFKPESTFMKSLTDSGAYFEDMARSDTLTFEAAMKELNLKERYPAKREVYEQMNDLIRGLRFMTTTKNKRGQMTGNRELAYSILKKHSINRLQWMEQQGKMPNKDRDKDRAKVEILTFTDEEREAFREQNPEIVALHEKIAREQAGETPVPERFPVINPDAIEIIDEEEDPWDEVRKMQEQAFEQGLKDMQALEAKRAQEAEDKELMYGKAYARVPAETRIPGPKAVMPNEIPLPEALPMDAVEPLEEPEEFKGELVELDSVRENAEAPKQKEPTRLSVREKHGPVESRKMLDAYNMEIDRVRGEIARLNREIEGKQTRLENEYQWWKFGERSARHATKQSIEKLQGQLKERHRQYSQLKNRDQRWTKDEFDRATQTPYDDDASRERLYRRKTRTARRQSRERNKKSA